ncbi:MAG TPA: Calx-beta domain-containing protein, partial [Actinomycetota bacterium]|nr:Calx-beta domain-containing protein [Actinomycetota bacterium]
SAMGIGVARSGNTAESGTLTVIARPGTASVSDFSLTDGDLNFAADDTLESASLQVVDDDDVEPTQQFSVVLTLPADDGHDGSATDTFVEVTVTIADNEVDANPPTSSIVKPQDGMSYIPAQLGRFKGLASDGNEIGIESVEIALRKNMKNGQCKWLRPSGSFVQGDCSKRKFLDANGKSHWDYELQKPLLPSEGSNIKSYGLSSRARDKAGNVEETFSGGNSSHFEVRQPQ